MIEQYTPWIDYRDIDKMTTEYLKDCTGWLTEFKNTKTFEEKIQEFLDVEHAIVVNNGTIAIAVALLAEKIEPGSCVLVPDMTMIATAYAVELVGCKPIFCDIESETGCMDLRKAREIISGTEKHGNIIRAVVHVSLNGRKNHWLTYQDFLSFCKNQGVKVIEDNAQSFGSKHGTKWISCPENGIGTFSFSMPKIITTGQGGCLVTNNGVMANRIRKLKDFGRLKGGVDVHDEYGINCKFTELQAITGLSQIKNIEERIKRKKEIYKCYKEQLAAVKGVHFITTDESVTPWFVDIYAESRNDLIKHLEDNKIKSRAMYPALHTQPLFKDNYKIWLDVEYTEATRMSSMGLWLPSSMTLSKKDIDRIIHHIKEFYVTKALDNT